MRRTFGPLTLAGGLALAGLVRPAYGDRDEARAAGEQSPVKPLPPGFGGVELIIRLVGSRPSPRALSR